LDDNDLEEYIKQRLNEDIADCENYQASIIKPAIRRRYEKYYADENHYKKLFPKISKSSNLVDTSVADTIEWALPSLMRQFLGTENPCIITGVYDNDQRNAEIMQDLITYQLMRNNNSFLTFYNWFKDAMITGLGVVKCSWDREEKVQQEAVVVNYQNYINIVNNPNPNFTVVGAESADEFGNMKVTFESTFYSKNSPKVENILISEFLFPSNCKNLIDAHFVAHKKKVTMSYLRQKEKEGVYTNINMIKPQNHHAIEDDLEQEMNDNYSLGFYRQSMEEARREVVLYECYVKIDINQDGILEDMIITKCEDVILRMEENVFGRHPFFNLSPVRDPHRIFPKRSFAEMIGQLQDLKTALIRQIMINIALSNDPRVIMSEDALNIDDYIQGRSVIRKKPGYAMSDVVMPVPIQPLHPWTFQFLEYVEGQKENRTGITRYNQGLDGSSLNKTATGISAIMSASNQRLELIARMFAETGISELFRFIISLNQKFIDKATVVRITDRELTITPDDLAGEMDLVVSAGVSTKEQNMMILQTLMTAILQVTQSGIPVATPTNVFNLMKKWMVEAGIKNTGDYLTDPAVVQQRMMVDMQLRQQVLATLPLPIQQEYMATGTLRPEIMQQLSPEIQQILGGFNFGTITQGSATQGTGTGEFGGGATGVSGGLATGVSGMDNRKPKGMQPSRPESMA